MLKKINGVVSTRLVTKAGTKGVINLTKLVPILGGIVGGGMNVVATRVIGRTAVEWLKDGPPPAGTEGDEGAVIDAEPEGLSPDGAEAAGAPETAGENSEPKMEA